MANLSKQSFGQFPIVAERRAVLRHGRRAGLSLKLLPMGRFMIMFWLFLAGSVAAETTAVSTVRPVVREANIPNTRWTHQPAHVLWNRTALSALKTHGKALVDMVPADYKAWCPAYRQATEEDRRAFWVGFLSSLAKFESTYKPRAVGGGGKWFGLVQISPATARGYGCNVGTGEALRDGSANLSCAIRIMAVTVPRDGVIHNRDNRWRGVSADWGPMRSASKRADMANWLRRQPYCQDKSTLRPRVRPELSQVETAGN